MRNRSFYIHEADENNTILMKNPHLHQDYEIYYLLEGERYYDIQGQKFKVKENQLVFIDKNMLHQTKQKKGVSHKRIVLNFHGQFLSDGAQGLLKKLFEQGPHVVTIPKSMVRKINQLFTDLLKEYQKDTPESYLYFQSLLTQLLIDSRRMLESQQFVSSARPLTSKHHVSNLLTYIHSHYHRELSLSMLASQFHLNEHYISRVFKRVTGYSFTEYVNRLRVAEAERLLNETDGSVQVIAKQVGYKTNVHFHRVFKKIKGISPNQYRQK